jgi:leucyl aminopeptidase
MQFSTTQDPAIELDASCIVVSIDDKGELSSAAESINQVAEHYLTDIFESGDFSGKTGETLMLVKVPGISAQRLILVGSGKASADITPKNYIKVAEAAAGAIKKSGALQAALYLQDIQVSGKDNAWKAEQAAIACENALYFFDQTKSKPEHEAEDYTDSIENILWAGDISLQSALEKGQAIARGVSVAKDLGNMPANICTPTYLAEQAEALAEETGLIETIIIDETELETMGAGAFVSVAKGSSESGKFIIMKYQGAEDANEAPHMILGKGITFDTGGISLKPGAGMDEMKFDMCGAASVLGAMTSLTELKPKVNIIGMITTAENMPAGNASKPGDVVTTLSGQTVEILNTDAEGRLVLCDALTYAIDNLKPASIVDIATLTGACMMALGTVNSGLFTENEALAAELQQAALDSHDKVWRLPLEDDYQEQLDSNFADIANIGGRLAGSTTAACFLARFTKGQTWAHLDIAGTAWHSGGKNKGSTGRPVPLLVNYLLNK